MDNSKIAIIGLGYVGLPLSIEFGKVFKTIGFDTKQSRVADLKEVMIHHLKLLVKNSKSLRI